MKSGLIKRWKVYSFVSRRTPDQLKTVSLKPLASLLKRCRKELLSQMTEFVVCNCRDSRFCEEKMRVGCKGHRRRDRRLCEVRPCCKLSFAGGGGDVRLVFMLDWRILQGDSEKHDSSIVCGWASG